MPTGPLSSVDAWGSAWEAVEDVPCRPCIWLKKGYPFRGKIATLFLDPEQRWSRFAGWRNSLFGVASAIKALISRKDLTEAQIMVGIQGLVAGTVAPTRSTSERLVST